MPKPNQNVNRKLEFLETAQALFNEKGFENTSIDDIVKRMEVAKGLFYYYFDSKEELLSIIFQRLMDEIESSITGVMEKKGLTALERYRELILASSDVASRASVLMAYFHQERNQSVHLSMEKRSREFMVPVMERIIVQGNQEGVFHAKYPHETAIALVSTTGGIKHIYPFPQTSETTSRLIAAVQDLTERLLVMEPGSFRLFEEMYPPKNDHNDSTTMSRRMKRCSR